MVYLFIICFQVTLVTHWTWQLTRRCRHDSWLESHLSSPAGRPDDGSRSVWRADFTVHCWMLLVTSQRHNNYTWAYKQDLTYWWGSALLPQTQHLAWEFLCGESDEFVCNQYLTGHQRAGHCSHSRLDVVLTTRHIH